MNGVLIACPVLHSLGEAVERNKGCTPSSTGLAFHFASQDIIARFSRRLLALRGLARGISLGPGFKTTASHTLMSKLYIRLAPPI